MKFKSLILALSICLISCSKDYIVKPFDPKVHYDNVYLIMGQSNATGVASWSFLETKAPEVYQRFIVGEPQVLMSYDMYYYIDEQYQPVKFGFGAEQEFFGPEIGIADVLRQENETSYIIKATLSGSCLQDQYMDYAGTKYELYDRFASFIMQQLNVLKEEGKNPRLRGLFWMQGEGDSIAWAAKSYGRALKQFVNSLRKDFNEYVYGYMNFVDAYISTKSPYWENPNGVNEGKESFKNSKEHNYCIKTNGEDEDAIDLTLKSLSGEDPYDAAHYDSLSMLLLGQTAGKLLLK